MRNLKRVLSLALAVVMVIGMMVMTTGAAEIVDIDDVKNVEAVTVMNALEILEGDENGTFNPTGILTREQAAKIVCYMLMGPDNAEMLAGTSTFTDVAADRWSAPFIAYCASLDIIAGNGDGTFNPTGELTGVAFAKMLLVALGYDATIEGYVNNANWATNIGSDAIDAGLNIKGVDLAAAVTRDNAAQMAFNTLKATMVRYDSKGTNITMSDGTSVVVGASAAEPVFPMNAEDYSHTDAGDASIQFCEKYFEDLKTVAGGEDAFGRPNRLTWELDGEKVFTVANKAAFTFTAGTKAAALTKAMAGYTIGDKKINETYTLTTDITVGDLTIDVSNTDTTAAGIARALKNGTLVELYANQDKEIYDVVVVDYNVSKVTNITTNKTTGDVTYTLNGVGTKIDYADDEVYTDQIKLHGDIGKFDIVTVCTDGNGKVHVYPTTSFEGTQTSYKVAFGVRTVTIDGENYVVGEAAADATEFTNKTTDWTYYVDQYGFVVALEEIEKVASDDYVYILDVDQKVATSYGDASTTVKVKAMLADGTKGEYTVAIESVNAGNVAKVNARTVGGDTAAAGDFVLADTKVLVYDASQAEGSRPVAEGALLGNAYGYTFNEDGEIELELLGTVGTLTKKEVYTEDLNAVDPGETKVGTYTLLTDDTTFVVYDSIKKTVTTYTAAEAADAFATVTGVSVITATSTSTGTASVVFVNAKTNAAATKVDVVYVDASAYVVSFDVKGDEIYTYTAYTVDGEKIEQTTDSTTGIASGLYERNNKDEISGAPKTNVDDDKYVVYAACTIEGGMVNVGGTFYTYDNAKVVDLTKDQYGMAEDGFNAYFVLNEKPNGTATKDIAAIFVVE